MLRAFDIWWLQLNPADTIASLLTKLAYAAHTYEIRRLAHNHVLHAGYTRTQQKSPRHFAHGR